VTENLVLLVGSPNVGKSALFNRLTGAYVTVSNYPGTTVEVSRGKAGFAEREWEIIDTPGMYSLLPMTEEERVARNILLERRPRVVLHVVDAKNLERHLPLTIQLLEAGVPLILVLNMMDELENRGIGIDIEGLSERLGVPVVPTVSVEGRGIRELKETIACFNPTQRPFGLDYGEDIEAAAADRAESFRPGLGIDPRTLGLLAVQGDEDADRWVSGSPDEAGRPVSAAAAQSIMYRIASRRQREASRIATEVTSSAGPRPVTFSSRLSALLINPWTGFPVLLLVLYFGLYKLVGEFGAGVCVDFLEGTVFEKYVNPFVVGLSDRWLQWGFLRELIAGEYGIITLGVRYAVAIILPIVTLFFLVFSIMEDTGYLPRLALLIDRIFKKIGLSGRGVIPIVLGLGCDSMATIVTRTLPTKRERIIGTLLLALAVPCSAQLGVILALLQGRPAAFAIWTGVVCLVFLVTGFLAARIVPGDRPRFYIELPPLRLPKAGNVFMKTYTRVHWYVKEVFPVFILASVLIWAGQLTGVFDWLVGALAVPVRWMGLPTDAATVFLFGFFRRDYGAAGLYDLNSGGALDWIQLTVATVALTLFLPCIAQFLINIKERGAKIGFGISIFVLFFSFGVACALNWILRTVVAVS